MTSQNHGSKNPVREDSGKKRADPSQKNTAPAGVGQGTETKTKVFDGIFAAVSFWLWLSGCLLSCFIVVVLGFPTPLVYGSPAVVSSLEEHI